MILLFIIIIIIFFFRPVTHNIPHNKPNKTKEMLKRDTTKWNLWEFNHSSQLLNNKIKFARCLL